MYLAGQRCPVTRLWVSCRLHKQWAFSSNGDLPVHFPSGLTPFLHAMLQRLPVPGWACTLCAHLPPSTVPEKLHTLPALLLQHDSYLKAIARALHRGNSESQFAAVVVIKYLVAHSASTHYVLAQVSHLSLDCACVQDAPKLHGECKSRLSCLHVLFAGCNVHAQETPSES